MSSMLLLPLLLRLASGLVPGASPSFDSTAVLDHGEPAPQDHWGSCDPLPGLPERPWASLLAEDDQAFIFAAHRRLHPELYGATSAPSPGSRLPGEFEPASTLLLSFVPYPEYFDAYGQIIEHASHHGQVQVLHHPEHRAELDELIDARAAREEAIDLVDGVPFESPWIRDYGPTTVVTGDEQSFIDSAYFVNCPDADALPSRVAGRGRGTTVHRHGLFLEGGNLLSNGGGLCLTATTVARANGLTRQETAELLRTYYGCARTEFLLPMVGDVVDHVDMFAAFADHDVVLVGQYRPDQDPTNAIVLDVNAAILAATEAPGGGPLRIVRVPMPDHAEALEAGESPVPRSYLNLTPFNGVVLVPVYETDRIVESEALAVIMQAFPDREVVPVIADSPALDGGAVHCLTSTLPRAGG